MMSLVPTVALSIALLCMAAVAFRAVSPRRPFHKCPMMPVVVDLLDGKSTEFNLISLNHSVPIVYVLIASALTERF